MIVFDVSALVSAALKVDSVPEQALLHAAERDVFALSPAVWRELVEVLDRPKFTGRISQLRRRRVTDLLLAEASWFEPETPVSECRDPADDKYLELALASNADFLVSGDNDLLVLHPWRGVHILRPAAYLEAVAAR